MAITSITITRKKITHKGRTGYQIELQVETEFGEAPTQTDGIGLLTEGINMILENANSKKRRVNDN